MITALLFSVLTSTPTYTNDIKPLFQKKCAQCHNAQVLPHLDWTKYENVFKYRESIYKRTIVIGDMPMGSTLNKAEKKLIKDWIRGGAPK